MARVTLGEVTVADDDTASEVTSGSDGSAIAPFASFWEGPLSDDDVELEAQVMQRMSMCVQALEKIDEPTSARERQKTKRRFSLSEASDDDSEVVKGGEPVSPGARQRFLRAVGKVTMLGKFANAQRVVPDVKTLLAYLRTVDISKEKDLAGGLCHLRDALAKSRRDTEYAAFHGGVEIVQRTLEAYPLSLSTCDVACRILSRLVGRARESDLFIGKYAETVLRVAKNTIIALVDCADPTELKGDSPLKILVYTIYQLSHVDSLALEMCDGPLAVTDILFKAIPSLTDPSPGQFMLYYMVMATANLCLNEEVVEKLSSSNVLAVVQKSLEAVAVEIDEEAGADEGRTLRRLPCLSPGHTPVDLWETTHDSNNQPTHTMNTSHVNPIQLAESGIFILETLLDYETTREVVCTPDWLDMAAKCLHSLGPHPHGGDAARNLVALLTPLTNSPLATAFADGAILRAVLEILTRRSHAEEDGKDHVPLLKACMQMVGQFASNPDLLPAFDTSNFCAPIRHVIAGNAGDAGVVQSCCLVLSRLSQHLAEHLIKENVPAALLGALPEITDPEAIFTLLASLQKVVTASEERWAVLLDPREPTSRAMHLLVTTLERCIDNVNVVQVVLGALLHMTASEYGRKQAFAEGAVRVVIRVGEAFLPQGAIRGKAMGTLVNLVHKSPEACAEVVAEGGVKLLMSAMEVTTHDQMSHLTDCCKVLSQVARSEEGQRAFLAAHPEAASLLLVTVLAKYTKTDNVAWSMLAIGNLCQCADVHRAFAKYDAPDLLLAALGRAPPVDQVRAAAAWALSHFLVHPDDDPVRFEDDVATIAALETGKSSRSLLDREQREQCDAALEAVTGRKKKAEEAKRIEEERREEEARVHKARMDALQDELKKRKEETQREKEEVERKKQALQAEKEEFDRIIAASPFLSRAASPADGTATPLQLSLSSTSPVKTTLTRLGSYTIKVPVGDSALARGTRSRSASPAALISALENEIVDPGPMPHNNRRFTLPASHTEAQCTSAGPSPTHRGLTKRRPFRRKSFLPPWVGELGLAQESLVSLSKITDGSDEALLELSEEVLAGEGLTPSAVTRVMAGVRAERARRGFDEDGPEDQVVLTLPPFLAVLGLEDEMQEKVLACTRGVIEAGGHEGSPFLQLTGEMLRDGGLSIAARKKVLTAVHTERNRQHSSPVQINVITEPLPGQRRMSGDRNLIAECNDAEIKLLKEQLREAQVEVNKYRTRPSVPSQDQETQTTADYGGGEDLPLHKEDQEKDDEIARLRNEVEALTQQLASAKETEGILREKAEEADGLRKELSETALALDEIRKEATQVEDLQKELLSARNLLAKKEDELSLTSNKSFVLEEKLKEATHKQQAKLEHAMEAVQKGLAEELERKISEIDMLNEKSSKLQHELAEAEHLLHMLPVRLPDDSRTGAVELLARAQEAEARCAAAEVANSKHLATITRLQSNLDEARGRLAAAEEEPVELLKEVERLEGMASTLRADYNEGLVRQATLEKELKVAQKELADLQAWKDEVQSGKEARVTAELELLREHATGRQGVSRMEARMLEVATTAAELQRERKYLAEQLREAREELEGAREEQRIAVEMSKADREAVEWLAMKISRVQREGARKCEEVGMEVVGLRKQVARAMEVAEAERRAAQQATATLERDREALHETSQRLRSLCKRVVEEEGLRERQRREEKKAAERVHDQLRSAERKVQEAVRERDSLRKEVEGLRNGRHRDCHACRSPPHQRSGSPNSHPTSTKGSDPPEGAAAGEGTTSRSPFTLRGGAACPAYDAAHDKHLQHFFKAQRRREEESCLLRKRMVKARADAAAHKRRALATRNVKASHWSGMVGVTDVNVSVV